MADYEVIHIDGKRINCFTIRLAYKGIGGLLFD
jgi:hypothetical protein